MSQLPNSSNQSEQLQKNEAKDEGGARTRLSRNERRAQAQGNQRVERAPKEQQQQQQKQEPRGTRRERKAAEQQQVNDQEVPRRLSLRDIFRDEEAKRTGRPADDLSKPPKDVDSAIKRLNMKPEEFDEISVSLGEGIEPMPFKALREKVGGLANFETERTRFESHRIKMEAEILRSREEMREILSMIPADKLPQQLIEKVRKQHGDMVIRERQSTIDMIPAWSNEKAMEQDSAGMRKFMSKWGFPAQWVDSIHDHRAVKFIRDMYLRDMHIEAALAEVTTPEDTSQRSSGKGKGNKKPQEESQSGRRGRTPTQKDKLMDMFR